MKSRLNSLLISVAFVTLSALSSSTSFAQASGSGEVSATIVTPVTVAKLTDLEFSNVPVDQTAAAAAAKQSRMAARAKRKEQAAAATTGTVTAASFTVSGYANYVYGVTMPAQVTKAVGNRTVTIGTSLSAASADYTLSARGTDALSIQGTLSFGSAASSMATSLPGANSSTDVNDQNFQAFEEFPVTIIYN